jgi:hypothetical protein
MDFFEPVLFLSVFTLKKRTGSKKYFRRRRRRGMPNNNKISFVEKAAIAAFSTIPKNSFWASNEFAQLMR